MELRHLRYFLAVAESQHFGRAAEALRVSQPTLSQQVADLERELGFDLFERLPRGVALTDAGRAFAETVRQMQHDLAQGVADARDVATGIAGRLVVGLPETTRASVLAADAIESFRRHCPRIEVISSGLAWLEHPLALLDKRLDVGFAWSTGSNSEPAAFAAPIGLHRRRLFNEPANFALMAVDHPLATHASLTTEQLRAHPFTLFDRRLYPALHDAITAALQERGIRPPLLAHGIASAGSTGPLLAATRAWALVPSTQAQDAPPGTVAREIRDFELTAGLDVLWRADDDRRVVAQFCDACVRAVGDVER